MEKRNDLNLSDLVWGLLLGLSVIWLVFLTGCKRMEYTTVEKVVEKHDTLRLLQVRQDSIHVRDSIFAQELLRGDTVVRILTRERVKYVERLRVDTLRETRFVRQKEPAPYPVYRIEQRDKPLSWWQRALMRCGALALLGCLLFLSVKAFPLLSRFHKP